MRVIVYNQQNSVLIDILDTGKGIKDISKSSKKSGNGIGVKSAKGSLEGLNYESISGIGTATRIRLA